MIFLEQVGAVLERLPIKIDCMPERKKRKKNTIFPYYVRENGLLLS